ncbi:phosphate signaling complex PhoU family protein [Corynebacterium caspium]|uniref:phosphate signaling complex PhoU family protein n=1 Tax=Corynebacterium caspium TaxID=234828 RepID=UPI00037CA0F6|nr:phosphate uptake regulator PhoU [Corynebacterium caspium]WKD58756.1 hypothetical protein CCASP_01655 [Corynebacterium caspium DSM 44850]
MRTAYREHLDAFAHDLIELCEIDRKLLVTATKALLSPSLSAAEDTLSMEDQADAIVARCEARALELVGVEGPEASDLLQVVSSIYIVEDLRRMGSLARNVAALSRRRHPQPAIPETVHEKFKKMATLCEVMVANVRDLLTDPDADTAVNFSTEDDEVDDLHQDLLDQLTMHPWPHSTREAVDVTLLGRYYERYADHCVNVATRVLYLTTGRTREEYLAGRG